MCRSITEIRFERTIRRCSINWTRRAIGRPESLAGSTMAGASIWITAAES
ncbi:hypothetical protein QWZ10_18040 [Paracoccus cavernae]|uniref:Uncharacterized protein n=1 Tax=Paracoccus cavernae TaxID=1571207 RepID=A0ABT8D8R1_9RHOB|nr:hypothetical protein [Paracoccus cavernae]